MAEGREAAVYQKGGFVQASARAIAGTSRSNEGKTANGKG